MDNLENLITIIVLVLVFGGAAIGKFLTKILGAARAGQRMVEGGKREVEGRVREVKKGKRSKSILDMLAEGDLEAIAKRLSGEEDKEEDEEIELQETVRMDPVEKPFGMAAASAATAAGAHPVVVEPRRDASDEKEAIRWEERRPAETVATRKKVARKAPRPRTTKPRAAERGVEKKGDVPVRLRLGGSAALREAIVLREIFGPPKAFQMHPRPGMPGAFSGAVGPTPRPAFGAQAPVSREPAPAAAPAGKESSVPPHVAEMFRMGMITREQYEELREFFVSRPPSSD